MSDYLTPAEAEVIKAAGDLWGLISKAIPDGPARMADLGELVAHVHGIQRAFMANAAARAYPDVYRALGASIRSDAGPGADS